MAATRRFRISTAGCGVGLTIGRGEHTTPGVCGEMRWYTMQLCDDCRADEAKLNRLLGEYTVAELYGHHHQPRTTADREDDRGEGGLIG